MFPKAVAALPPDLPPNPFWRFYMPHDIANVADDRLHTIRTLWEQAEFCIF